MRTLVVLLLMAGACHAGEPKSTARRARIESYRSYRTHIAQQKAVARRERIAYRASLPRYPRDAWAGLPRPTLIWFQVPTHRRW